jgi:protein-tyrosine-phosphatase
VDAAENILFVCVENAGRSQMAEAFFKKYLPKKFNVISTGTSPANQLNTMDIQVMKEIGIDLNVQKPKLLSDTMIKHSSKIVNMGYVDRNLVTHCLSKMLLIGIFLIQKKNP